MFVKVCRFGGCPQDSFNRLVKILSLGFVYFTVLFVIILVSKDLQTYCPLGIRIFAVSIDPKSMAAPRNCPSKALSSGKVVWS